ncbi:MAG: hypothetical protein IKE65_09385 [Clostridia bacterium]|nr:hypothetical protein [Clostridia bacterium]
MKKNSILILVICLIIASLAGCSKSQQETTQAEQTTTAAAAEEVAVQDGTYSATFKTDSSMFHVNDAYNNKGVLTVKDGSMSIHIVMPSKKILKLFAGTAEQAKAEGAALIEPTTETVKYDDGTTEEVYAFDIPVPYLDKEFDCALIGKKGIWYDHKVTVSNPESTVADGEYTMAVTMTGGTGKASIDSPAEITIKDGKYTAKIVWSSSHYEEMKVGDTSYKPVNKEGNSTFLIPIEADKDISISALTTAMSEPHWIDYVLHFDSATLIPKG